MFFMGVTRSDIPYDTRMRTRPYGRFCARLEDIVLTYLCSLVPLASNHHGSSKSDFLSVSCCCSVSLGRLNTKDGMIVSGSILLTETLVGLSILGRSLLPGNPLPHRLPFQASKGQLHHQNLPPKYQLQRLYLLRYSS